MARKYGISASTVLQANDLSRGKRLYAGQILTIPLQYGKSAPADVSTTVASAKSSKAKTNVVSNPIIKDNPNRYMVKNGDTLWEIATAYGVSISDLKRLNDLSSNNVYAGRWLKIPERNQDASVIAANITYEIYKVRRGDNLSKIADKYDISADAIKEANQLSSNKLYVGMSLKIPSNSSSGTQYASRNQNSDKSLDQKIYTVRRGDTLWKIAKAHGVEISDLAKWNNISLRSKLSPGDKLKIYL